MSRRHTSRRRKHAHPLRQLFSPLSLLFAAVTAAWVLSTRSLKTLPTAYQSVFAHSSEELGSKQNKSVAISANGITEAGQDVGSVSSQVLAERNGDSSGGETDGTKRDDEPDREAARNRHKRSTEQRKKRRAELHDRVAERGKKEEQKKSSKAASGGEKKEEEDVIPAGARTTGSLEEFHGSKGGTEDGMIRGQNVTRVSYTLYKVMRLFGFASLTDSPAGAHAEWMVDLVRRLAFDVPFFVYKGVDNAEGLEKARKFVGEVIDGEYFDGDGEKALPNGTDVLFHWTELDGGGRDPRGRGYMMHMAKVMRVAKTGGFGYVVFGQYPRLNGPSPVFRKGKWKFVGTEEEEPFLLNEHVRGVVPTASGGKAYMLYLTFYSLRSIPMEAIDGMDVDAARLSGSRSG